MDATFKHVCTNPHRWRSVRKDRGADPGPEIPERVDPPSYKLLLRASRNVHLAAHSIARQARKEPGDACDEDVVARKLGGVDAHER